MSFIFSVIIELHILTILSGGDSFVKIYEVNHVNWKSVGFR
jgi:hypothetical protein